MKRTILSIITLFCMLFFSVDVHAVYFEDDFEDQSFTTSQWSSIGDCWTFEDLSASDQVVRVDCDDGLIADNGANFNNAGLTIETDVILLEGHNAGVFFAFDGDSGYVAFIKGSDGTPGLYLEKFWDSGNYFIAEKPFAISNGVTYTIRLTIDSSESASIYLYNDSGALLESLLDIPLEQDFSHSGQVGVFTNHTAKFNNFQLDNVTGAGSSVAWWHIQKRSYENGNQYNRLGFAVIDTTTSQHVTTDVVSSVSLYENVTPGDGSSGDIITIPSHSFNNYKMIYGHYNTDNDNWFYDDDISEENYFRINYTSPALTTGTYRLEVTFNDGSPAYSGELTFNGLQTLPTVSSDTFYWHTDTAGNFIWGWKAPYEANMYASGETNTSIRCWLSMFNGDTYVGDIWVKVPTQVPMMYVPKSVMDLAATVSDNYKAGLQIRTNDNNNRYYTNQVTIDKPEKSKEKKKVVVIPLL